MAPAQLADLADADQIGDLGQHQGLDRHGAGQGQAVAMGAGPEKYPEDEAPVKG